MCSSDLLFFSKGERFSNNQVIQAVNKAEAPQFDIWFLFEEKTNDLTAMRFDLCEEGLFMLKNIYRKRQSHQWASVNR